MYLNLLLNGLFYASIFLLPKEEEKKYEHLMETLTQEEIGQENGGN